MELSPTQVVDDDGLLTGSTLLNLLREWFPKLSSEFLQGIAVSQAVRNCQASLSDLYSSIATGPWGDHSISIASENELSAILSGNAVTSHFPYIRCRLSPYSLVSGEQQQQNTFEKGNLSDMLFDNLYKYAASFYLNRCHIGKYSLASSNCNYARLSDTHVIQRIDFIAHPKLLSEYEEEKEKFRNRNITINEKLLFHGTHATNLNKILDDNFKLTADPICRGKVNSYGEGIYFSEFPAKSLRYGEALLLCKVILGKEEVVQIGCKPATCDDYFQKNFNSRKIVNSLNKNIYMVPNPHQILPCYVIYLNKKGTRKEEEVIKLPDGQPAGKLSSSRKIKSTSMRGYNRSLDDTIFPINQYLGKVEAQYQYIKTKFVKKMNRHLRIANYFDIRSNRIATDFYSIGVEV